MVDHTDFWVVVGASAPVIGLAAAVAGNKANKKVSKVRRKKRSQSRRLYWAKLVLSFLAAVLMWAIVMVQGALFLGALTFLWEGPNYSVPNWLSNQMITIEGGCIIWFPLTGWALLGARGLRDPKKIGPDDRPALLAGDSRLSLRTQFSRASKDV